MLLCILNIEPLFQLLSQLGRFKHCYNLPRAESYNQPQHHEFQILGKPVAIIR